MGRIGNGLGMSPGLEGIAQRIHIRIRAYAGVAEQVPGAAQGLAPLQDEVALARAVLLQVTGRPDAGYARAHDQYIDMLDCHNLSLASPWSAQSKP